MIKVTVPVTFFCSMPFGSCNKKNIKGGEVTDFTAFNVLCNTLIVITFQP